jgi:hypothetical protein
MRIVEARGPVGRKSEMRGVALARMRSRPFLHAFLGPRASRSRLRVVVTSATIEPIGLARSAGPAAAAFPIPARTTRAYSVTRCRSRAFVLVYWPRLRRCAVALRPHAPTLTTTTILMCEYCERRRACIHDTPLLQRNFMPARGRSSARRLFLQRTGTATTVRIVGVADDLLARANPSSEPSPWSHAISRRA